jgi:hypothetical protein
VVATGFGFGSNETVTLHAASSSGPLLASTTSDVRGNLAAAPFIVPARTPGAYPIYGVGQSSGALARTLFTLLPSNTPAPTSGSPGGPMTTEPEGGSGTTPATETLSETAVPAMPAATATASAGGGAPASGAGP